MAEQPCKEQICLEKQNNTITTRKRTTKSQAKHKIVCILEESSKYHFDKVYENRFLITQREFTRSKSTMETSGQ